MDAEGVTHERFTVCDPSRSPFRTLGKRPMTTYLKLSDEELLERLHRRAAAHEAELVEEQTSGAWNVRLMRYNALGDADTKGGVKVMSANGPDPRTARETLLYMVENAS
jgi:hypothetical protein